MGIKEDEASEILSHIFGIKSGPTFFEGLVDAEDESAFEQFFRLNGIKSVMACLFIHGL